MANEKILVVEDESIVALDLENKLEERGYNVVGIAANAKDAIQKAVEQKPDLILMDIKLDGEMDGIEAAGQIHLKIDVPVIYLTAFTDDRIISRAKSTEPSGYLVKPYSEETLHTTIQMALNKFSLEKNRLDKTDWLMYGLNSFEYGLVMNDSRGNVVYMNQTARDLLKSENIQELGERNISDLLNISKTGSGAESNPTLDAMRNNKEITVSDKVKLLSADNLEVFLSVRPIHDENKLLKGAITTFKPSSNKNRTSSRKNILSAETSAYGAISGNNSNPEAPNDEGQRLDRFIEELTNSLGECEVYLSVFQDSLIQENPRAYEYLSNPALQALSRFDRSAKRIMDAAQVHLDKRYGHPMAESAITKLARNVRDTDRMLKKFFSGGPDQQEKTLYSWDSLIKCLNSFGEDSGYFQTVLDKIKFEIPIYISELKSDKNSENYEHLFIHAFAITEITSKIDAFPIQGLTILTVMAVISGEKEIAASFLSRLNQAYKELKSVAKSFG